MDPLDARMKVIGADKVPRPAIDQLMDDLKGKFYFNSVRNRRNSYIWTSQGVTSV